jgi:hypothetical protein
MVTLHKWNKFTKTRIGYFYEGAQGTPISYVYNDGGHLMQDTFLLIEFLYLTVKTDIHLLLLMV